MSQSLITAALLVTLVFSASNPQNTSEEQKNKPNKKVMAQEKAKVYLHGQSKFDNPLWILSVFDEPGVKKKKPNAKFQVATDALLLLRKGNGKYRSGQLDEAVGIWRDVIKKYPNTPAWNMAILNSGHVLQSEMRYQKAIKVLAVLLSSKNHEKLSDKFSSLGFPTEEPSDPMDPYLHLHNNDWHDACSAISACYESLGMLGNSYEYAVLSRDKYVEWHWCGLCAGSNRSRLDKRIATLEAKIKKKKKPDQK